MPGLYSYIVCMVLLGSPLVQRWQGEAAEAFVLRQFPTAQRQEILNIHPVIEYAWGDETQGKKLLCFLPGSMDSTGMMQARIWLPQGEGWYRAVKINRILFAGGGGPESVLSVFFQDMEGDGDKELFFIKEGTVKDYQDIVTDDGTVWRNAPYRRKVYSTYIYRQKQAEGQYLDAFEAISWPYLIDRLAGLKTAGEVKKMLRTIQP